MAFRSPDVPDIIIEGLEFMYRPNFEGRAEKYNDEGNRYFNAKIPSIEMAQRLAEDGWNVKFTKPSRNAPNPEEHVPEPYLEVTVGYAFRPPLVILIRDGRQQPIGENLVGAIDSMEFDNIDVSIRAYAWSNDTGSGIKAYLKEFYGTVTMDDLRRKYNIAPIPTDDPQESEAQF